MFPSSTAEPLRDALDDTIESSFPASDSPSSIPDPSYGGFPASSNRASGQASGDFSEGPVARSIEAQTAKLPSDTFLWAALGSMAVSAGLQVAGKRHASLFVGQWAPAFLLLGVYNKLVKELGSDRYDRV